MPSMPSLAEQSRAIARLLYLPRDDARRGYRAYETRLDESWPAAMRHHRTLLAWAMARLSPEASWTIVCHGAAEQAHLRSLVLPPMDDAPADAKQPQQRGALQSLPPEAERLHFGEARERLASRAPSSAVTGVAPRPAIIGVDADDMLGACCEAMEACGVRRAVICPIESAVGREGLADALANLHLRSLAALTAAAGLPPWRTAVALDHDLALCLRAHATTLTIAPPDDLVALALGAQQSGAAMELPVPLHAAFMMPDEALGPETEACADAEVRAFRDARTVQTLREALSRTRTRTCTGAGTGTGEYARASGDISANTAADGDEGSTLFHALLRASAQLVDGDAPGVVRT